MKLDNLRRGEAGEQCERHGRSTFHRTEHQCQFLVRVSEPFAQDQDLGMHDHFRCQLLAMNQGNGRLQALLFPLLVQPTCHL